MSPEEIYLQNLPMIERIAAFVARRSHLNADEVAEFVQEVRVRLLENDYAILRKFENRSSLSTYLNIVIQRLHNQWRIEQWGKWRPSAEAKRLGQKAIALERLLRDGFTFAEAVKVLTTPAGSCYTVAELEALYVRLPVRPPRPVLVSDEMLPDIASVESDVDERLEFGDRERSARMTATVLDAAIDELDPLNRVILQMLFWNGCQVAEIARALQLDQKKLYKQLNRLFRGLREKLEKANVTKADIFRLLNRGDQEIELDLVPRGGNSQSGHSHKAGGENVRGGEGRKRKR